MGTYVARRVLLLIATIFVLAILIFLLIRIAPGDIALSMMTHGETARMIDQQRLQELRRELGLDKPLYQQFTGWLTDLFRLDLGNSMWTGMPVAPQLGRKMVISGEIGLGGLLVALVIAIPVGIIAAVRQDRAEDYVLRVFTIIGLAIPHFWLALVTLLILMRSGNWSPPIMYAHIWADPLANLSQLILPMLILGAVVSAPLARMLRSSILEIIREDYIRTARAKGLSEGAVVLGHAVKNALIPSVTLLGFAVPGLIGGVVVLEVVFNIPGIGVFLVDAVIRRDYTIVQSVVLVIGVFATFGNLLVDLAYAWLDPRIKYG